VVKHTLAQLNPYWRLKAFCEWRIIRRQAFLILGCALICWYLGAGFYQADARHSH
jgi:hypothetical protein